MITVFTSMPSSAASSRADVEVHHVARVVAVEIEHALAAVHRLGGLQHDVRRRRGEDVADGRTVRHALADEAVIDRLMTRTTADEQRRGVGPQIVHHDGARADLAGLAVIGQHQTVEQFVGALEGVVDDFLGGIAGSWRAGRMM